MKYLTMAYRKLRHTFSLTTVPSTRSCGTASVSCESKVKRERSHLRLG